MKSLLPQECLGEHNRNWVKCQKGKKRVAAAAARSASQRLWQCPTPRPLLFACCAEVQALKECHAKQQQLQASTAAAKRGS